MHRTTQTRLFAMALPLLISSCGQHLVREKAPTSADDAPRAEVWDPVAADQQSKPPQPQQMVAPPGPPPQPTVKPDGPPVAGKPTGPKPSPMATATREATIQKTAETGRPAAKKPAGARQKTALGRDDSGAAVVGPPTGHGTVAAEKRAAVEAAAEPAGEPTRPDIESTPGGEQKQATVDEENSESATWGGGKLNLSDLPLTFGGVWSLDRSASPVSRKTQCLLTSQTVNISDGYDRTNVRLVLTADTLYVTADSNIDLSYPESGIHVDDGKVATLERLADPTTAVVSNDLEDLYRQLAAGGTALVKLGFWPTWPVTETQQASFPLRGFAAGRDAMQYCEQM